jgi:hypothetical protein
MFRVLTVAPARRLSLRRRTGRRQPSRLRCRADPRRFGVRRQSVRGIRRNLHRSVTRVVVAGGKPTSNRDRSPRRRHCNRGGTHHHRLCVENPVGAPAATLTAASANRRRSKERLQAFPTFRDRPRRQQSCQRSSSAESWRRAQACNLAANKEDGQNTEASFAKEPLQSREARTLLVHSTLDKTAPHL